MKGSRRSYVKIVVVCLTCHLPGTSRLVFIRSNGAVRRVTMDFLEQTRVPYLPTVRNGRIDHATASTSTYEEVGECSSSLRFHEFHGDNIDLSDDRTTALRRTSFANSIVFSARPLMPFEPFLVSIERNENGWSGHMRLGLTSVNPNSRVRLPMYALPELSQIGRSWVFAISRHQFNDHNAADQPAATALALPRRSLFETDIGAADGNRRKRPLPTDVGSRVGVYFAPSADGQRARIHLIINGDDYCPLGEDIPLTSALYAVVDVYGTTKQVRVVPAVRTVQRLQELCKQTIVHQVRGSAAIPCLPLPDRLKFLLQHCD